MNTKAKETNKFFVKYFRRDGTPYPAGDKGLFQWAKDIENFSNKRVAEDTLWWGGWVSTVWMGLDHSFLDDPKDKPLIFETMVFNKLKRRTYEIGGKKRKSIGEEVDMERYSTEKEAIQGHNELVKKWSNPIFLIKYLFKNA